MKICVLGLWHLGCVTAACVAERFLTIACDPDADTVAGLLAGKPPLFEPGLEELIREQTALGHLTFISDPREAVRDADIVWIAFDTPVDSEDKADVEFVARNLRAVFPALPAGSLVLISSQVPIGFTARMETEFRAAFPDRRVSFAYSPENLRLGKALQAFRAAERIIVGTRCLTDRNRLEEFLGAFCSRLEWMGVESAEMTKHALNAFLANSIVFINEIASLGESVGADAKEVERGLKSDVRIGPRAYLTPGGPFAGGTLARDVAVLGALSDRSAIPAPLLKSIYTSNQAHKDWPRRKLLGLLGGLRGKQVAVLGLTYKPGTDTLRRSLAVELCQWLAEQGATAKAYDPLVRRLPPELSGPISLCSSAAEALAGSDALVLATEWPDFKHLSVRDLEAMRGRVVIDPNRFLDASISQDESVVFAAVGWRAKQK